MAAPEGIALAPNDNTFAADPTWVYLDDPDQPWALTGFEIQRGKSSELERNEPGSARLFIVDRDGSFDPTNPSAAFPLRVACQAVIRVQNPITEAWRYLFSGFAKEYPGDFYQTGDLANVTLQLGDGFDYLAGVLMAPGSFGDTPPFGVEGDIYYPATTGTEQVQARLNQVLDEADWPSAWRHVFSGNIDLQAKTYSRRSSVMLPLEEAVEAEFPAVGLHHMNRRGEYIFRGRYPRFDPDSYLADDDDERAGDAAAGGLLRKWKVGGQPQALADLGTEAEGYTDGTAVITDLAYRFGWDDVINAALALPEGVEEADVPDQLVTDPTSIDKYGWRFGPDMENLLVAAGNTPPGRTAVEECVLYAQYWVENFSEPATRITRMVFRARDITDPLAPALWAFMLGVELGDVVSVLTDHYGRTGFAEDYFIEGIRYTGSPGRPGLPIVLEMELDVSPRAFYVVNPWE